MLELFGIKYLTEKEASHRYGYSIAWFQKQRWEKDGPKYVKQKSGGRIYYPVEMTDEWFKKNMEDKE